MQRIVDLEHQLELLKSSHASQIALPGNQFKRHTTAIKKVQGFLLHQSSHPTLALFKGNSDHWQSVDQALTNEKQVELG